MSSRFVSAGAQAEPVSGETGWAKARQQVESQRLAKPTTQGKQEDGRSLYEVLEANKAAKQEAFEEASKLRNQFRPLDDSEIEFLDSVRESQRAKEVSVRAETVEQIEQFRKQRAAAEQKSTDLDDDFLDTSRQLFEQESWATSKKRRRDKADFEAVTNKPKRASHGDMESSSGAQAEKTIPEKTASSNPQIKTATKSSTASDKSHEREGKTRLHEKSLLVTYDSSDDD